MAGVIEVSRTISAGQAIEEILLLADCTLPEEIAKQVWYVPLR
jgi:hypothetical protein